MLWLVPLNLTGVFTCAGQIRSRDDSQGLLFRRMLSHENVHIMTRRL